MTRLELIAHRARVAKLATATPPPPTRGGLEPSRAESSNDDAELEAERRPPQGRPPQRVADLKASRRKKSRKPHGTTLYDQDRKARLAVMGLCVAGPEPGKSNRPQHEKPREGRKLCDACAAVHARNRGRNVWDKAAKRYVYVSIASVSRSTDGRKNP